MSGDSIPRETFPGGDVVPGEKELRVSIDKKAYTEIMCHVQEEDTDVEICGVLVGKLKEDKHGRFLHILRSIRGEKANRKGAQVTFTHDTWAHINREKDTKYAELDIVGWYHTHPGFDVFLSDMDKFIHNNFFGAPHQVAYVYDPHQGTEGLFRNAGGEIVMLDRYWHGGKQRKTVPPEKRVKIAAIDTPGGTVNADLASTLTALNDSVKRLQLEVRENAGAGSFASNLLFGAMILVAALAFAYFGFFRGQERIILLEEYEPTLKRKVYIQVRPEDLKPVKAKKKTDEPAGKDEK